MRATRSAGSPTSPRYAESILRGRIAWVCALALGAGGSMGCRCEREKPFNPLGRVEALPGGAPSTPQADGQSSAVVPAVPSAPAAAVTVANPAAMVEVMGEQLQAPPGLLFRAVLPERRASAVGPAIVAALVPEDEEQLSAELWAFPSGAQPRRILALPPQVRGAEECALDLKLAATGPNTVTLATEVVCRGTSLPRAPSGWLRVVSPASPSAELVSVRTAPAAPGELLAWEVDSNDQDGDGLDDVRLIVRARRSAAPQEAARSIEFRWLQRAAGTARDTAWPTGDLRKAVGLEVVRAKGKKTSTEVIEAVDTYRRLLATACREWGTPRLFDAAGAAIACGNTTEVVSQLLKAEVTAHLASGQLDGATAALLRDGWYGGAAPEAVRNELLAKWKKALGAPGAAQVTPLGPVLPLPPQPHVAPVRFDDDGTLVLLTPRGVERRSPDGQVPPADAPPAEAPMAWPLIPAGLEGLTPLAASCNRSELTLMNGPTELVLPVLAPRPGLCAGGRAPKLDGAVTAVGAYPTLLISAVLVGPAPQAADLPGSPRASTGRWAAPTPWGPVLFEGPGKAERWDAPPEVTAAAELCVPNSDGKALLCAGGGQAWLLNRRP